MKCPPEVLFTISSRCPTGRQLQQVSISITLRLALCNYNIKLYRNENYIEFIHVRPLVKYDSGRDRVGEYMSEESAEA